MVTEHYRIGTDGKLTTEFSLRVDRWVRLGDGEQQAMRRVVRGHRGRELLWLDDCWRWAVQSGKDKYLPEELRGRFAEQFAEFDYANSPEFAAAVDARRDVLRRGGMSDFRAIRLALSEEFAERWG